MCAEWSRFANSRGNESGFNYWEGTLGGGFVGIATCLPDGFTQLVSPRAAVHLAGAANGPEGLCPEPPS